MKKKLSKLHSTLNSHTYFNHVCLSSQSITANWGLNQSITHDMFQTLKKLLLLRYSFPVFTNCLREHFQFASKQVRQVRLKLP